MTTSISNTMLLNSALSDFAARALAALNLRQPVSTAKGQAFWDDGLRDRPFTVVPYTGLPTRHANAPLAVARLRSVMREQALVRDTLRERVRNLGKSESLLGSRGRWDSNTDDNSVTLPAVVLFEMPDGYAKALAEYEQAHRAWTEEMGALEASIGAMRIKVQIGSDKALEALVEQVDKLCSMSLTASNRLLLGGK